MKAIILLALAAASVHASVTYNFVGTGIAIPGLFPSEPVAFQLTLPDYLNPPINTFVIHTCSQLDSSVNCFGTAANEVIFSVQPAGGAYPDQIQFNASNEVAYAFAFPHGRLYNAWNVFGSGHRELQPGHPDSHARAGAADIRARRTDRCPMRSVDSIAEKKDARCASLVALGRRLSGIRAAHHNSDRSSALAPNNTSMKTLLLALSFTAALAAQDAFRVKVTGHGPAMILIPGLSSSGDVWDSTVAHYQNQFQCHVLTLAGFAGAPPLPATGSFLDRERDAIAAYIREKKLDHPVIVGHSLGGYLALSIGAKYPDLAEKLVIVDSYPFLDGVTNPKATAETARDDAEKMRTYLNAQPQDQYEQFTRKGVMVRLMVTKEPDVARVTDWILASDRRTSTEAMAEIMGADLRPALPKIKAPSMVMATWIGYKGYADREHIEANLHAQYAGLAGADLRLCDTARHFIMLDDPDWMLAQMDGFLGAAKRAER